MGQQPHTEPTRKERREQARAQRKAVEEAQASAAARRKRLIQLGGIIGAVVVIIAVILIATSGGGSKTKAPAAKSATANAAAKEVTALLQRIQQNGNTLGDPKAPVTLQYFGDLECPVCKDFTLGALPKLIESYVRPGKLRIEYRSLETATRDPETFRTQQIAALAAGKQNKMWDYVELFYHEQGEEDSGYVTESYLQGLASQIPGLNLPDWSSARNDPAYASQVLSDTQSASQTGLSGTPSFLIGKTGGSPQKFEAPSLTDPSSFEAAIEKAAKR